MTSPKNLLLISASFVIISFLLIFFLYFANLLSEEHFKSIILAELITTFNAGLGLISIKSGINKPEKIFLRRIFGGMVIRFFSTLIMVVLALILLELNKISFIFSILFFYIFYLIIEIIYLNFSHN